MNNKTRMRKKNRRISLNGFKAQFDLQPYLQTHDSCLSAFQNSLMLMQILKKHEKYIFANRQNEVQQIMKNLQNQNKLLQKIKECTIKKKQKVLVSSFKVLQQLDLNRKHAYQLLEQQNKEIADRIYTLQSTLQRLSNTKKSQTLTQQYLSQLQTRIRNKKLTQQKISKILQQQQQAVDNEINKLAQVITQYLNRNSGGKKQQKDKTRQRRQKEKENRNKNRVETILEDIMAKIYQ